MSAATEMMRVKNARILELEAENERLRGERDEVSKVAANEIMDLRSRLEGAEETMREVACSGVEFEDERVSYVAVQIDRETWLSLAKLRGEES